MFYNVLDTSFMQVGNTLIIFLVRSMVKGSKIYVMITETNKEKSNEAIFESFKIYKAAVATIHLNLRYLSITRKLK